MIRTTSSHAKVFLCASLCLDADNNDVCVVVRPVFMTLRIATKAVVVARDFAGFKVQSYSVVECRGGTWGPGTKVQPMVR